MLLPGLLKEQLQAVGRQLFDGPDRFKAEPVEWVYDRCTPLLLPELLGGCKKGVPLSLAVLHASVSRRLGMPALPIKAGSNSSVARDTDSSTAAAKLLPTALAAKKAGRNSAAGPPVDPWLVAAPAGSPEGGSLIDGSTLVADPCARGGVSSLGEVLQRYPQLAAWKDGKETVLDAGGRYVLAIWAEYARCMLVAHQRRGESDLVAHWMYQVMALEPAAPEWRTATLNQD